MGSVWDGVRWIEWATAHNDVHERVDYGQPNQGH